MATAYTVGGMRRMADLIGKRPVGGRRGEPQQAVEPSRLMVDGREIMLGSAKVSRAFTSFAADLAMYACQRLVVRLGATALFNCQDFSAPPPQEAVRSDVDRSEAVFLNYYAVLPSMTASCIMSDRGLVVTAYARDQAAALGFLEELDREIDASNIYRAKCLYFSGNRGIEFKKTPDTAWEDVILPAALKDEIMLHTASFLRSGKAHAEGILKRGLILHGPPGTGKTTVVRSLFRELEGSGVTRIYVTNEAFERMSMDGFFNMIHYALPAMVVFEDIDLIGPSRGIPGMRGGLTGALLSRLDGVDKVTKPLVVVGTTNDVHSVDEALTNRPARFDRILEVPRPSATETATFYRKLLGADAPTWAVKDSEGFTGAHIQEVVITAKLIAEREGTDVKDALRRALKDVRKSFGARREPSGFAARRGDGDAFPIPGAALVGDPEEELSPLTVDPDEPPNRRNTPDQR